MTLLRSKNNAASVQKHHEKQSAGISKSPKEENDAMVLLREHDLVGLDKSWQKDVRMLEHRLVCVPCPVLLLFKALPCLCLCG